MLKKTLELLFKIDRRWLFLLLALSIFIPIIRPLNLPNKNISADVRHVYDRINALPPGSFILLSLDYDPSTRPELHPQAMALVRQAFERNLRVGVVTFIAGSTGLIDEVFSKLSKEYNKVYGKDYVIFPYEPNIVAVLTQSASNIYGIYDKDKNGNDAASLPVMKGITNYKDIAMVVDVTGTQTLDIWVQYAGDKYGVPVAGGVTAISQPGYGPYLQTGQLKGLIGGMKGAADYETLLNAPGKGTSGIDALNLAHILVVVLIVFSNLGLFLTKYL